MKDKIDLFKCNAYDEKGRSIPKDVFIFETKDNKWIISFGYGWCRYYVSTLFDKRFHENLQKEKPIDLCIDIMGRNHNNSPVYIKFEDVKKSFEILKEKGIIEGGAVGK